MTCQHFLQGILTVTNYTGDTPPNYPKMGFRVVLWPEVRRKSKINRSFFETFEFSAACDC